MNRPQWNKSAKKQGFALVISLLMMVMLTVLAVGLLSLSTISLRTASSGQLRQIAEANARLALTLALGDLQKSLGDDRRITADASILATGSQQSAQPRLVGVWDSATSEHLENPTSNDKIDYDRWKTDLFKTWLVSAKDEESVKELSFGESAASEDSIALFGEKRDGFDLQAEKLELEDQGNGSIAWAVVQEGDKAHISLPGEEVEEMNDILQAPRHPNLALSDVAEQPEEGWKERAAKVISLQQSILDSSYGVESGDVATLGSEYTTYSRGVIADVARGGLKTDLNLSFELDDGDFARSSWDGIENPFRNGSEEVPMHGQIRGGQPVYTTLKYGVVSNTQRFPVGGAPSFDMLRSHYRAYRHLYKTYGVATAFERPQVRKEWSSSMGAIYPAPRGSETAVTPVLDRMMYLLNLWADSSGTPWLVITPVITLWNPNNVAIESEGYVAYPWVDIPIYLNFTIRSRGVVKETNGTYLSHLIGSGRAQQGEGRQVDPYFFCNLTADGSGNTNTPIRLEPGEVRIFVPSDTQPRLYERLADEKTRTWDMRPVDNIDQLKLGGGVGIDTTLGMSAGPTSKLRTSDTLECRFTFQPNIYHYFTTLEDSSRIKDPTSKGSVINEVQLYKGSAESSFLSTRYSHRTGSPPKLVGVLETYHRTALQPGQEADIVHSVNTRQRYINSAVSGSKFLAGPHYNSSMRQGTTLAGLGLETSADGKRAFYGANNSASEGRDRLVLFDVPRQPPLSLASFQNADLSDTAFSPSNQFGNSWASPYVDRDSVGRLVRSTSTGDRIYPGGLGIYDNSWLQNEALWDGYFMSSISPTVEQRTSSGSPDVYNSSQVNETSTIKQVVNEWVDNPWEKSLRNSRLVLHEGNTPKEEVKERLTGNAGGIYAAAHLMVDGAFNVNSTHVGAWKAMLASLRGESFETTQDGGGVSVHNSGDKTAAPRLTTPAGIAEDEWEGFRELSDGDIEKLAEEIVVEVKERGPFQSLAEFVNRRVSDGDLGLKGALQAAIDRTGLNDSMHLTTYDTSSFFAPGNIPDANTGVGLAGWLTQADLLGPLASVITVRSDTFRIRGYGEAHDADGNVVARATCEALVQRVPEWIDPADESIVHPDDLSSDINKTFGRRFEIISFRMLSSKEMPSKKTSV